jgi:hypothetical protein
LRFCGTVLGVAVLGVEARPLPPRAVVVGETLDGVSDGLADEDWGRPNQTANARVATRPVSHLHPSRPR